MAEDTQNGTGLMERLTQALRDPESLVGAPKPTDWSLAAVGLGAILVYGAMAGSYQGGVQIVWAAVKSPLIVASSLFLCLPSLYVFGALQGANVSGRWILRSAPVLTARIGLLLIGLMPITWLFAVSSRWFGSVVWLHFFAWGLAVLLGGRFLYRRDQAGGLGFLWIGLVWLVSLQVETNLRPLLYRSDGAPHWALERRSFLEHFDKTLAGKGERPTATDRK